MRRRLVATAGPFLEASALPVRVLAVLVLAVLVLASDGLRDTRTRSARRSGAMIDGVTQTTKRWAAGPAAAMTDLRPERAAKAARGRFTRCALSSVLSRG